MRGLLSHPRNPRTHDGDGAYPAYGLYALMVCCVVTFVVLALIALNVM